MRFGFVGPGYTSQSIIADCQRLVNLRLEAIESQQGKSAFALYPEMGTKGFATLPDRPVRGMREINGRLFAVGGGTLYEVAANGVPTPLGAVANDGKPASLTASNIELLVAAGAAGYVYNLGSGLFTPNPAFLVTPRIVGYIKGFFVSLQDNSNVFQCSGALNGVSWDPTQKAAVSDIPDNLTSMIVDHNEVWLCGNKRAEGWYFSGDVFPFAAIPQAYMEMGTDVPFSPCRLDNSVLWWGQNEGGHGMAWRAQGYTPQRTSTHAIEYMVQGFGDISGAVSHTLQDNGHSLWRTYFPAANKGRGATLQYDVATGAWSELTFLSQGKELAHRSQCHEMAFGKHLVGDPTSGNIYELASPKANGAGWDFVTDDGNPIRRVRRAPVLANEDERMYFDRLVIDLETGLGPVPALTTDGLALAADNSNARGPRLMLRWSDDGGKTWSNESQLDCGQAGEFKTRVYKNKLGSTQKGRVFEVSTTDPVPWRFIDCYVNDPVERLTSKLRAQA